MSLAFQWDMAYLLHVTPSSPRYGSGHIFSVPPTSSLKYRWQNPISKKESHVCPQMRKFATVDTCGILTQLTPVLLACSIWNVAGFLSALWTSVHCITTLFVLTKQWIFCKSPFYHVHVWVNGPVVFKPGPASESPQGFVKTQVAGPYLGV